ALGADEQDRLALSGQVGNKLRRLFKHFERLLQIDDVNSIALAEDVFLHLGIPALRLMPEVNTRFEQLLHGDVSQTTSFVVCILCQTLELGFVSPPPHLGSREKIKKQPLATTL